MLIFVNLAFLISILFWVSFSQKSDIIETSETSSQILFSILIIGFWFLLSIFLAINTITIIIKEEWWQLSEYWSPFSFPFVMFPYIFILILPPISAIYSYINIYPSFKRKWFLEEVDQNTYQYKDIILAINNISRSLGLSKQPKILCSRLKSISPRVFSTSPSKHYLILPSNLYEMLDSISKEVPDRYSDEIKKEIRDFVITHELSHIKNKDTLIMSWFIVFFKSMKYYSIFFIPIILFYLLFYDIVLFKTSYNLVAFSIPLLLLNIIFLILSNNTLIKRELLADARAVANIREDIFNNLIKQCVKYKGKLISILEALFINFRLAHLSYSLQKNIKRYQALPSLGFAQIKNIYLEKLGRLKYTSWLQKLLPVFNDFSDINKRINFMKRKTFIAEKRFLPEKETVIWMGIMLATFTLGCAIFIKTYEKSYLYLDKKINYSIEDLLINLNFEVLTVLSLIFVIPLRNSINIITSFASYLKKLIQRFFIIIISFLASGFILSCIFKVVDLFIVKRKFEINQKIIIYELILPIFKIVFSYIIVGLYIFPILFVIIILFSIVKKLSTESMPKVDKNFRDKLIGSMISVCLSLTIIYLILRFAFGEVFIEVLLMFIVLTGIFLMRTRGLFYDAEVFEDLNVFYIFNKQFKIDFICKSSIQRIIFSILLFSLFVLPFILILPTVIYPLGHYIFLYLKKYSELIDVHNAFILPLLLLIPLGLIYLLFGTKKGGKPEIYLSWLKNNLKITNLLGIKISTDLKKKILSEIENFKAKDGGFKSLQIYCLRSSKRSNLYSTYSASEILSIVNNLQEHISYSFIKERENTSGGFGFIPNTHSRLSATFFALEILNNLNKLETISIDRHVSWIFNHYYNFNFFSDHPELKPTLRGNYFALKSLKFLSAVSQIPNSDELAKSCEELWLKSKRTEEDTWYFVNCLEILNSLSQRVIENFKIFWLPLYRNIIMNTRIDKHHSKIFYYLSILKILQIKDELLHNQLKNDFLKTDFFKLK